MTGDPRQDNDFAVAAKDAAIGLTFAAAASGALVTGVVLAASLGSVLTGTAFAAALFPWLAAPILDFAGALTLPAAYVGGAAAAAVGFIVGVVIVAITIAVLKGIEIVAAANLPGKLLNMIDNAQAAAPDLPGMLADTNQRQRPLRAVHPRHRAGPDEPDLRQLREERPGPGQGTHPVRQRPGDPRTVGGRPSVPRAAAQPVHRGSGRCPDPDRLH